MLVLILLNRQKYPKTLGYDCFRARFTRAVTQHQWLPVGADVAIYPAL